LSPGSRLLIVEDDPDVAAALTLLLERSGHTVRAVDDGRTALRAVHQYRPDLVILDVELPSLTGWEVLERVRDMTDVPVLMLTAMGRETDRVRGLRGGADDYLTKPFANAELVARVEALLRRSKGSTRWSDEIYDDGVLRLDPTTRSVRTGDAERRLTATEFRLLNVLVRNAGVTLTPGQLLSHAWDDPSGVGTERVKFVVLRLRRKLGWPDPETSRVESIRGLGYRYRPPSSG
jgi:DNA-binding response OmpR family regulator